MDSFPNSTTAISSNQEKVSEVMRIVCPVIAFLVIVLLIINYLFQCFPLYNSNIGHETSASSMISDRELHDLVHVTIIDRPETTTRNTTRYPQMVVNLDKTIPVLTYSSSLSVPANGSSTNYDENCSICLCELSNGETVRVLPKCKHIFHKECIDEWLPFRSLYCPICRAPVIELSIHERRSGTNRTNGYNSSRSSSININPYGWSMPFTSLMLNLDQGLYPLTPTLM
ncbi:hypothetical protein MKX01_039571 [Papaver californicum]|nr:hypothetical protein MKX01_039571 [Papaver californicum]